MDEALVAIGLGLGAVFNRHAEIFALLYRERGQLDADFLEVQASDFLNRDRDCDECPFCRQGATASFAFGALIAHNSRKLPINFLFVRVMADTADKKVEAIADEETVGGTPSHKLQVVSFHFRTSRMAIFKAVSW